MKVNSINQQTNRQNFKGSLIDKGAKFVIDHPKTTAFLAGSSVIAQKVIMSGSEAIIGPAMDVGIGHTLTKVANEKDNRTNESSKAQAIRTFAQATGGTIVGVVVRAVCIGAMTALAMKAGGKMGEEVAKVFNPNKLDPKDVFKYQENASAWGKALGGALSIFVMLFTNFLIDAPFINKINKKVTDIVNGLNKDKQPQQKEAV